MAKRAKATGLEKALKSKIGRRCWFTDDNGIIIEGTLKRGRKVEKMTSLVKRSDGPNGERNWEFGVTIYTVPQHIKITMGPAPTTSDLQLKADQE